MHERWSLWEYPSYGNVWWALDDAVTVRLCIKRMIYLTTKVQNELYAVAL